MGPNGTAEGLALTSDTVKLHPKGSVIPSDMLES